MLALVKGTTQLVRGEVPHSSFRNPTSSLETQRVSTPQRTTRQNPLIPQGLSHRRPTTDRDLPPRPRAGLASPALGFSGGSRYERRVSSAASRLLFWYRSRRRDLPWRKNRDPYRVLVAEIMLQQTQVATVAPRYESFLSRFPSVESLAAASEEEVVAAWSGLGYYRRARLLRAAAAQIVARPGGFPRVASALAQLSGVGAYTAAAVASIAFGEAVAVVDGNVERVMTRRLGLAEPVSRAAVRRRIREAAGAMLVEGEAGDSNQALMELGATVCRPRGPLCEQCPVAEDCEGFRLGIPEAFPVKSANRARESLRLLSIWVEEDGALLLFRRPLGEEWLAGMWELPTVSFEGPRESRLASRYGGRFEVGVTIGSYRHAITYRDLTVELARGRWAAQGEIGEGPEARWFAREELAGAALSAMVSKAAAVVERQGLSA